MYFVVRIKQKIQKASSRAWRKVSYKRFRYSITQWLSYRAIIGYRTANWPLRLPLRLQSAKAVLRISPPPDSITQSSRLSSPYSFSPQRLLLPSCHPGHLDFSQFPPNLSPSPGQWMAPFITQPYGYLPHLLASST